MAFREKRCLNLKKMAGRRYRVRREPGDHTPKTTQAKDMAWYWEIVCQYGVVYPYSDKYLIAYAIGKNATKKNQLIATGLEVMQDGAFESSVKFLPEQFKLVAKVLKPRRRRRCRPMTEEEKEALRERFARAKQRKEEERLAQEAEERRLRRKKKKKIKKSSLRTPARSTVVT